MSCKPNVFLPLDDCTVLVGLQEPGLRVVDVISGETLRVIDPDSSNDCYGIIRLPDGRIAASFRVPPSDPKATVVVYDLDTGTRLAGLLPDATYVFGLGYSDGHLLAAPYGNPKLCLWRDEPGGAVSRVVRVLATHKQPASADLLSPRSLFRSDTRLSSPPPPSPLSRLSHLGAVRRAVQYQPLGVSLRAPDRTDGADGGGCMQGLRGDR